MRKTIFGRYADIFAAIYNFSPIYVFITIGAKSFFVLNTYVMLYINRLILNKLSYAIGVHDLQIASLVKLLSMCCIVEIASTLIFNVFQYHLAKIKMRYDDSIALKLSYRMSNLDMSFYDDPQNYNLTRQLGKDSTAILINFNNGINLLFSIVSLGIAFHLAVRFNIWIVILAVVSVVPSMVVRKKLKMENYTMERALIKEQRFTEYLLGAFYNKNIEMEMQLYDFRDYIRDKASESQENVRNKRIKHSLRNAQWEAILLVYNKAVQTVQKVLLFVIVVTQNYSIGDYSYYGGVAGNLASSLNNIVSIFNDIRINDVKYQEYLQILSQKPKISLHGRRIADAEVVEVLAFENVSFTYPNAAKPSLTNVSFQWRVGERIAFVGENGAGKTTLIKLILRFYDPTDGRILLDGIDIREYELNSYRKIFSAMFQDVTLYSLTIEENIALSALRYSLGEKRKRIWEIIKELDLESIQGEHLDLNKYNGREFHEDGYVFSKGQQQKIHSARSLYGISMFNILDEPAASMDALSEKAFLDTLEKHTVGKGVIYITHRYHNLHTMDSIFVISHGEIIEKGSHEELIKNKRLYYQLYVLQEKNLKEEHYV